MKDYSPEDHQRYESYLRVHLKKDQLELTMADQIEALDKRSRSRWWHLLVNVAAIIFFGYSFYFDITQLSRTFFVIIMAVFLINTGLILYQRKQINELILYLKSKHHDG